MHLGVNAEWQAATAVIGARERLVRDGAIDIWPLDGKNFSTARARSALGITAEGKILMVTLDERHARMGATIPEMAELMRDLGAVDAVNIDGGGSTLMAARRPGRVDETIVNAPATHAKERPVANALHVVSTLPTGPLATLIVDPPTAALEIDQNAAFQRARAGRRIQRRGARRRAD